MLTRFAFIDMILPIECQIVQNCQNIFPRLETLDEVLVNEHKGFANLFVVGFHFHH